MGRLMDWFRRGKKQNRDDRTTTFLMQELRAARKENQRLTTVIIHMQEAGKQYVPQIADEDFGTYAIEEEERRQLQKKAGTRTFVATDGPRDIPWDEDEGEPEEELHPDHEAMLDELKQTV